MIVNESMFNKKEKQPSRLLLQMGARKHFRSRPPLECLVEDLAG